MKRWLPLALVVLALVPFTLAKAGSPSAPLPGSAVTSAVPGAVTSGFATAPKERPRDEKVAMRFARLFASVRTSPTAMPIS